MKKTLEYYRDSWKDILTNGNHTMFLQRKTENHKDNYAPLINLFI